MAYDWWLQAGQEAEQAEQATVLLSHPVCSSIQGGEEEPGVSSKDVPAESTHTSVI